ncbi:MAG: hypothetical protein IJC73_02620 [Lentisphaeria bacterium]|nr:hypothetical protein [Lentisphaeria bacterium]
MNRSILIVICDFIVSSMLTMIAGLSQNPVLAGGSNGVPLDNRTATVVLTELRREQEQLTAAHRRMLEEQLKSGNPAEKKAELESMTRKLAEAGARIELLEKQLALTPDTAGALRAEQLQSQLEHELNQRHLLRLQQQETEAMLEELRRQNRLTGEKYQDLREQFAARQTELRIVQQRIGAAETELTTMRGTLAERNAELGSLRRETAAMEQLNTTIKKRQEDAERELALTRGKLLATEQSLAETQSRYDRAQQQITDRDLKIGDMQRKEDHWRQTATKAIAQMSKVSEELKRSQTEVQEKNTALAKTSVELKATREKLAQAQQQLKNDVLANYSAAVVKLQLQAREKQLLFSRPIDKTCYLPLIEIAGKTCLISDLRLLLGNQRERNDYSNLAELIYAIAPAAGTGSGTALTGPLLIPAKACALALMEAPVNGRVPLKVLTMEQLKKRGVQELYLFKHGDFGKSFAPLEDRCSVDLNAGSESLRIRNIAHGTGGTQLRAEPGDFVMTKQGEFVAIVTDVEITQAGRRNEARCSLVPENFSWQNTITLSFARLPGETGLTAFDRALRPVLDKIEQHGTNRRP